MPKGIQMLVKSIFALGVLALALLFGGMDIIFCWVFFPEQSAENISFLLWQLPVYAALLLSWIIFPCPKHSDCSAH